jgi:hypothetical protein
MTNPTVLIHNAETNEVIEREMNAEELAQWQAAKTQAAAEATAEAQKAADKAALLAKLGITEDEARLLLS